MKYNLIFFGSPEFTVKILSKLAELDFINVRAVVTNPDKPQGRKQILTPTPVAQYAQDHHLPVFKPQKLDQDNLKHLELFNPDIFLVVAYGKIIPTSYLETPKIATLNVHYSLLPKYRGALCVKESIQNGDKETGVTLMEMDKDLDHGPIISKHLMDITPTHQIDTLTSDLTDLSIQNLPDDLLAYLNYKTTGEISKKEGLYLPPVVQNHDEATYTQKTNSNTKENAYIAPESIFRALEGMNHEAVSAKIRANTPDPGAWTQFDTQKGKLRLNILESHILEDKLIIDTVQIAGRNPISWRQLISGYTLKP